MPVEYLMFWLRETLSNIVRNRLMSLLAISTVTVGLFILGTFYLIVMNLKEAAGTQTRKLDLVLFLQHDVSAARRNEIVEAARIPQVKDVKVLLKDTMLAKYQRENPDIPMSDFKGKNNPFSDEIHLQLKQPDEIFKVRAYFNTVKGVDKVQDESTRAVRQILAINRAVSIAGVAALFILGVAILLIIHNAIRLTIYARRREIRIMAWVGATPWFISMPFLLEGALYGLVGALLAGLVLTSVSAAIAHSDTPLLSLLIPLAGSAIGLRCSVWMCIAGVFFGLAGSWISISRSLDQAAHS